jgi:hypothetical protein
MKRLLYPTHLAITMLARINKMKLHHQVVFAVVIAFAVISFWRGTWGLMDLYLFSHDYNLSLWASVVIGILILVATNYATKELM